MRETHARVVSVYEAVDRGQDKVFALKRKKEDISTKKAQLRHPHDSGDPGPQRRANHHDLHPHDQEHDHQGGETSVGFLIDGFRRFNPSYGLGMVG